jgi:hypothetical protein
MQVFAPEIHYGVAQFHRRSPTPLGVRRKPNCHSSSVVKIVVDMNLPPAWMPELEVGDHTAVHWSSVGDLKATDASVMAWARTNAYVVFTHDLDFGALLALTAQTSFNRGMGVSRE